MVMEGQSIVTPLKPNQRTFSQASSPHPPNHNNSEPSPPLKKPASPHDFISSVASKIAAQPLQNYSEPDVWGVLTAISTTARKRPQGINVLLTADEHCIGRLVDDIRFQIESPQVSAFHCRIFRKRIASADVEGSSRFQISVFLKDTSTNGTYLNWEKLKKDSAEAKLHHGDIISFAAPPQFEQAFAFVFREVPSLSDGTIKRKAEEFALESKRVKGLGIGAPEGPISLDDFRSLQRSNMELRKQLEDHVLTIDTLQSENRATAASHEIKMKELKESVAQSYVFQLKELNNLLEVQRKELAEVSRTSAEQKHGLENLNERLNASMQSFSEANEIISSQKASISELKEQLDEERDQRKEDREKAASDMKSALQRAQLEAEEEMRRVTDAAVKREREQEEVINKIQESEKEKSSLVEALRSKLEDTRQKLVISDNEVRQLETQLCEERKISENGRKRTEELEHEVKRLLKDRESEKAAREEAWAKVSSLELEISAAMRDLEYERRRLKGARERIMLRETQLRAFYSTTEEIQILFARQQEQLKTMQRTLEDEENYDNISVEVDVNETNADPNRTFARRKEARGSLSNNTAKAGSSTSGQRLNKIQDEGSSDEASVTEKHECHPRNQEGQNTEEADFTSAERLVKGGFGSDIDGVDTAPCLDGDLLGTEIHEIDGEQNVDTMEVDGGAHLLKHQEQNENQFDTEKVTEDTEAGCTIRTADLLASEIAGSWAGSTAPSIHGENDSPKSRDDEEEPAPVPLHDSNFEVAESQSQPPPTSEAATARRDRERRALSEMIGIVAPDLREQFSAAAAGGFDNGRGRKGSVSDTDTEADTDNDGKGGSNSASETEGSCHGGDEQEADNAMDEDDEATQEDSTG